MEKVEFTIEGMTCEHCVRAVRGRLEHTPGVKVENVQVGTATIEYDPSSPRLPPEAPPAGPPLSKRGC